MSALLEGPQYVVTRGEDLQEAIYEQQANGGVIRPSGLLEFARPVITTGRDTLPVRPCVIRGYGIGSTVLRVMDLDYFTFNGLFGYNLPGGAQSTRIAQVDAADFTIDGNYKGVDGGLLDQRAGHGLVSLPQPWGSAYTPAKPQSAYHRFSRVKFYRAPGYGIQALNNCWLTDCEFDGMGQPDLPANVTHYDNIGSGGWGNGVVESCNWTRSSGNPIDLEGSTAGRPVWCRFQGNVIKGHQIGGIYCLGRYSIVRDNIVEVAAKNVSGVNYDGLTIDRGGNQVTGNVLAGYNRVTYGATDISRDNTYPTALT